MVNTEKNNVDLEIALQFVDEILKNKAGRSLRSPEITIFRGTWQGMTYEQMADSSSYSANYLMRDIAPKFWKLLSEVIGENVGKSSLRIVLAKLYASSNRRWQQPSKPGIAGKETKLNLRDWENAPALSSLFYGRELELETLQKWVNTDQCQLLGLWGLSGTGKTCLMKKFAEQIQEDYEIVIWRSLNAAPSLQELIKDLLQTGFGIIEQDTSKLLAQLIAQIRAHSCLILLDGIEAILQPQAFSGKYLSGYEDYGEFFRLAGESSHQSCVVITTLENPGSIMPATSNDSAIRHLNLSGLTVAEATSLLKAEKITLKPTEENLIEYYQGNPAILTTVAQIICELFSGNVSEFLGQKSLVFGEINHLLNKSFSRLSTLETEILYWLTSEPQPMSLSEIQNGIPLSIYPVELIEALESLTQRSLIKSSQIDRRSVFVLSPMMREFITNQFIAQIGNNFSVAERQNSLLSENTIKLGKKTHQPTRLSQWMQNRFELDWQSVETLFAASSRSPARLRSAFNLRGDRVIKRFKQIDLGTDNPVTVILLIAISQQDSGVKICVQAQPAPLEQILPANLQLNLSDPNNNVLATIKSQAQDNFIQLPYFQGVATEKFKISLKLNSANYEEDFMI